MWSEGEAEADAKHLSRADRVGTHIGHHFVADGAYVDGLAILQPGTGQLFLDPSAFPFVSSLEASWHHVRDEFEALPHDAFDPWVQRSMHGEGWSIYGLFVAGERIEGACRNCPRTAELIGRIDGVSLAGFSRLAPRSHIKPHEGWAKSVYRLHLGLVVPPDCRFRVGAETRSWHEGECLVFDDTVEHEAWNGSDRVRGVLLLDFLRPGVTDFTADAVPEDVRRYADKLLS